MINVFAYTDHCKLLHDLYEDRKSSKKHLSHRYISQKLGINSSAGFSNLIKRRTFLSDSLCNKLSEIFDLKKKEAEYFTYLVHLNQSKNPREKKACFEEISHFIEENTKKINPNQHKLYKEWYYSAIWALLSYYEFKDDYAHLARQIYPEITEKQAKKAITVLSKLGLIRRDKKGYYKITEKTISSGESNISQSLIEFHVQMIDLARAATEEMPKDVRHLSGITVAVSEKVLNYALEEISKCRKKVMEMIRHEKGSDRVYQFNFQAFPLTKIDTD